jgi:hypothetical protein
MLPPFIIEQIRKREEEERRKHHQPALELPLPLPTMPGDRHSGDDDADRGVVILDIMG